MVSNSKEASEDADAIERRNRIQMVRKFAFAQSRFSQKPIYTTSLLSNAIAMLIMIVIGGLVLGASRAHFH